MHPLHIVYLNGPDIDRLGLRDGEILDAVERCVQAEGHQRAVADPRMQLGPESGARGRFNVLGGVIPASGLAAVMVAADFADNREIGLPCAAGMLTLFDPATGVPLAILNANSLIHMRSAALTALGGKYLARKTSTILGHLGSGEAAYWNIRLLNHVFDFDEIRVHSSTAESWGRLDGLSRELGKPLTRVQGWQDCVRGADIVVEASPPSAGERGDTERLAIEWIRPGTLVISCDATSSASSLIGAVDKRVVDDRGPCANTEQNLYADLGQIVAHSRPGRAHDTETILYRQYGLALADVALGSVILDKAGEMSIGQTLRWE